jgi:hypothetical protein
VSYQWKIATTVDGIYSNIVGETLSTYTLEADDLGKFIKVEATGTGVYSGTIVSAAIMVLGVNQTAPDSLTGLATINNTTPEVVITDSNQVVDVTISSGTTTPKINVSAFITGGTGVLPQIIINSANANNTKIEISATTTITSADVSWDGVIAAPTITTVTLPETSGQTKTLSTAIEIGFTGAKLSFDKAVRILLPNQAGKRAGYVRTGTTFTEITAICAADNQTVNNALAIDGDCKIDVGSDLVIWTKHFTNFATYTQTTNAVGGGGGGGSYSSVFTGDFSIMINNGATNTSFRA